MLSLHRNTPWYSSAALGSYSVLQRMLGVNNLLACRIPRTLYFAYKRYLTDPYARLPRYLPNIYSGGSIFDVGANIGYTASIFRAYLGRNDYLYAFEAEESNAHALKLAARTWSNVECLQCAVGDECRQISLLVDPNHPGNHRVLREECLSMRGNTRTIKQCPSITLDAFVDERSIAPSKIRFLKIDVQGFEPAVIAGAKNTLRHATNLSVSLEFEPTAITDMGFDPNDLLSELRSLGFKLFQLLPTGRFQPLSESASNGIQDILCLR